MIFEIGRVSKIWDTSAVREFNTLEELSDFAKEIDEKLIITFPDEESHGKILIYDDYIE